VSRTDDGNGGPAERGTVEAVQRLEATCFGVCGPWVTVDGSSEGTGRPGADSLPEVEVEVEAEVAGCGDSARP
jgi:hypothetical protein